MSSSRGAGGMTDSPSAPLPMLCLDDDELSTPGGKKRKVPVPLMPGSEADADTGRDGADRNPPRSAREDSEQPSSAFPVRRLPRSAASCLASQRRALFHRRKASLVALYIDAQSAVDAGTAHLNARGAVPARPTLPDVSTFERLLPALEDVGVWAPDASGWREGDDSALPTPRRVLERWRTGFARRKRVRMDRVPVVRGGWAPEGSFELDMPTDASNTTRARARERVALARLAEQLRALVLATNKVPTALDPPSPPPSTPHLTGDPPTPPPPGSKKNKKKKKKRTTLANEGNPHHVDKYRPSRPVPVSDPYEPWPWHANLLWPHSMRILAARPGGHDVRPAEDEYICVSCQYALNYGSESLRKLAIKERKAELRRREKLRSRVQDATRGGNRSRRHSHSDDAEDDDDYDDVDDDECDSEDEDGSGRCSCGRALGQPHMEDEARPPDKDPPA